MDGLDAALRLLPGWLQEEAAALSRRQRQGITEIRLRRGWPATLLAAGEERVIGGARRVREEDLRQVLSLGTGASPYAAQESLARGFITAPGGVRVGFCGEIVAAGAAVQGIKHLSSAALRIPREVRGCASELVSSPFVSTLLISPPGGGKTTLLRDTVRLLSEQGQRVALCDERGEVAASFQGEPGFDVGRHTDVLTGGPKAESAMMLLRNMGPEVLAMDEITAPEDMRACETVSNCGVAVLATAHGADPDELRRRKLYRELLEREIFVRAVMIEHTAGQWRYREEKLC